MPHGIEVLVKKASLDSSFCALLVEQRAAAAREISLDLSPAETAILDSVPEAQLRAMIDRTTVPDAQRRAFLGKLGAAMLATVVGPCQPPRTVIVEKGIRPEDVPQMDPPVPEDTATPIVIEKGIRPDDPILGPGDTPTADNLPETTHTSAPAVTGTRPEQEEEMPTVVLWGIRPDRP
jgi:hypothetical protein